MTKKTKYWQPVLIVLMVVCLLISGLTFFVDRRLFIFSISISGLAVLYALISMIRLHKDTHNFLRRISDNLDLARRTSLINFPLPVFAADEEGYVLWYNDNFRDKILEGEDVYTKTVSQFMPGLSMEKACMGTGTDVVYNDKMLTVYATLSTSHDSKIYLFYIIDETELKQTKLTYQRTRPCAMLLVIDNYEELTQYGKESERRQVISEIEGEIENFVAANNGLVIKVGSNKFIAILEVQYLEKIVEERFSILDEARKHVLAERIPVTLSIGVGRDAPTLAECEQLAKQSLDMALGRGGDQAAVKTVNGFNFYGGASKSVEKRTKVKTRIIASALSELVESCDNIIIMGHRFADLDAVGSAAGLYMGLRRFGKNTVIAIDKKKNSSQQLISKLMQSEAYQTVFVDPKTAMDLVSKRTLLIIVDTHTPKMLESEELYRMCKNVVVVDHHRKMVSYIENAVIFFHEPYASSASEMVTELIQYLCDDEDIDKNTAEALLSGLMLDTNNFTMRTGVRTFEAAAYLRRQGADTVEARKLFSSSLETFQQKTKLAMSAEIYNHCAICTTTEDEDEVNVVAAQAADELLTISDVDASFVIYEHGDQVSISARSMGKINVQVIMEQMGGGGHHTQAGAQMSDTTVEKVRDKLIECIDNYLQ